MHGHTVVEEISSTFSGKVINIDFWHKGIKTQGLLIENAKEYIKDGKNEKKKLKVSDDDLD